MAVERTLFSALDAKVAAEADEARAWLKRTESFLEWVSRHPKLVEINAEAAHLLARYREPTRRAGAASAAGSRRETPGLPAR